MELWSNTFDLWASTTTDGGRGALSIGMNCFCRWLMRAKVCVLRADCEILFKSAVGTGASIDYPTLLNRFLEPFSTKYCAQFEDRKSILDSLAAAVPSEAELAASERFRRAREFETAATKVQRFARHVIAKSNRTLVRRASLHNSDAYPSSIMRQASSDVLRQRVHSSYGSCAPSSPTMTGTQSGLQDGCAAHEVAETATEVAADLIRFRSGKPLDSDYLDSLIDVFAALAVRNASSDNMNRERVLLQQCSELLLKAGMQKPDDVDGKTSRKRGVPAAVIAALYARCGGKPLRGLDADCFLTFVAAVAEAAFPTMPLSLRDQCVKDLLCCAVEALYEAPA